MADITHLPLTDEDHLIMSWCCWRFWSRLMTGPIRALMKLYAAADRCDADEMLFQMMMRCQLKPRDNYIRAMDLQQLEHEHLEVSPTGFSMQIWADS